MQLGRISTVCFSVISLVSCATRPVDEPLPAASGAGARHGTRLFDGLDLHLRSVTTSSKEAQRWFDQGFLLCFGFNHEEAIRSFQVASELDSSCAMAWWGMALAAGPNINNPTMDEERTRAAFDAIQVARERMVNASPVERALIEALSKRYVVPAPADRRALDEAYANAMREVWKANPTDADVGALFAESMMDLRPWDLWTADGAMQPGTLEVLDTLAAVLKLAPKHPGGNHYSVHAWEASPTPEKALDAANVLRDLVPGAGHLVHMPAHIDLRVGHYADAVLANQRAIEVDRRYMQAGGVHGFNDVYRAHNFHFLQYAAMFEGQSAIAIQAARDSVATIPREVVLALPQFLESFQGAPYHALVRFGRWDDILREPEPEAVLYSTRVMHHYARGIAFAATGRVDEAQKELAAFDKAFELVPESYLLGNNPTRTVLQVARPMLEGELEYRRGNHERAFELLGDAAKRDDALHYDEPWGWMMPVRHALGALLLEQGRVAEAEQVYRADLERHRENGWALHGLVECLRRSGREALAREMDERFRAAWVRADVEIHASCYCRSATAKS